MKKETEDWANKELSKVQIPLTAEGMLAPHTAYLICKDGNVFMNPTGFEFDCAETTEYLSVKNIFIKFGDRLTEKEIQALKDLRKP